MRERLSKEESGFTLVEVMVTMMLMIIAMFALYSVFDMSIRVFSFGNDKVEAVENARLGLAKMEREIRSAYPYNKPADDQILDPTSGADKIVFGNDLDGSRTISSDEIITYRRGVSDPTTLQREKGGVSNPVVEYVDGLTFDYLKADGSPASSSSAKIVRVTLKIKKDDVDQQLTTDVALRNRSN